MRIHLGVDFTVIFNPKPQHNILNQGSFSIELKGWFLCSDTQQTPLLQIRSHMFLQHFKHWFISFSVFQSDGIFNYNIKSNFSFFLFFIFFLKLFTVTPFTHLPLILTSSFFPCHLISLDSHFLFTSATSFLAPFLFSICPTLAINGACHSQAVVCLAIPQSFLFDMLSCQA